MTCHRCGWWSCFTIILFSHTHTQCSCICDSLWPRVASGKKKGKLCIDQTYADITYIIHFWLLYARESRCACAESERGGCVCLLFLADIFIPIVVTSSLGKLSFLNRFQSKLNFFLSLLKTCTYRGLLLPLSGSTLGVVTK